MPAGSSTKLRIERVERSAAGDEVYEPWGAARELFSYRGREVLVAGPAGTGKSRACLEKINLACMQKPVRCAMVRKTRKSLTQSAMETFEEKVLTNKRLVPFHTGDQEYRYPNGARVIVGGLDDAEKIGSTEFDLVYCVVGETRVSSPSRVERGYARVYTGPLVIITTALGHELTGTPNHPVLTDEGWVALGSLREGQQVVSRLDAQWVASSDPHVDDEPAPIAEIVRTLALLPTSVAERIEGVRMDFHGDGTEGQIDVVLAGGEFEAWRAAAFDEPTLKDARLRRDLEWSLLTGTCPIEQLRLARLSAAVESGHTGAESAHARAIGFGSHPAQARVIAGRAELPVPAALAIANVTQGLTFTGRAPHQSTASEFAFEARHAHADRKRNGRQSSLTGQVTLDRIIDVRRTDAGRGRHVYNLQTASGYYFANSIVTHNCQEATELDEEDWGMLLRGLRNGVASYQQILADCNPTYPSHWLKQRCDRGEVKLLESRHEDNPTLWDRSEGKWTGFGENYIKTLDSLEGYLYRRLRLGEWCAAEGMYFTEYEPKVHLVDSFEVPHDWPRWVSVDYGFAVPFCALWFAREPETRKIFVYREVYASGLRDEQQAEMIRQRSEGERILQFVLDPAMFNARTEQQRPSIAQVYVQTGVWPVYPGMNSRKQGWAIVRRALAHGDGRPPRLQLMRDRCPNLIRELPAQVMDQLDPEDVADVVRGQKINDHAVDAARYGLCAEAQPVRSREPLSLRFG